MVFIVLGIVTLVALYFSIRYFLLKSAVKEAAKELHEITQELDQNRIVKLSSPQHEMEGLLESVNQNLQAIRKERIQYEEKEVRLQNQIENISHDLRTPLTAILGFLDLIDENTMSEEDRESLEVVKRKAGLLKKLIAQFYDLSRLSANDYKLEISKIDIGRQLRETVIDSYQELLSKNLEVTLDIPKEPVEVMADEDALERIFLNLLQNAGRYAKSKLNIHFFLKDENVVVLMENDTDNFKEEDTSVLFERFYTADSSRSEGSTGLGLSIAKYLAQSMGGELVAKVTSRKESRWLQFYLSIPGIKRGY